MRAGIVALVLALAPRAASADPADLLGFGARAAALANAGAAVASGGAAAMYNPAGVALAPDPEVQLGYTAGRMNLEINGRDANVVSPRGVQFGLALPIQLGKTMALALGVALFMPDHWIVRVQLLPATEPRFILYDNDVNRIAVNPVLALKINDWLSIGGGASILANAAGNGIRFDVGVEGGERVGQSAIDIEMPTRAAPMLGAVISPTDRLRLGLAYRDELDLRMALEIVANVDVAGVVVGDAIISLRAINFYTPPRLSMGAAWTPVDGLTVTGDLVYTRWRRYHGGVAELEILVDLGVTPSLAAAAFPQDRFNDTLAARGGLEARLPVGEAAVLVRGGVAYEPSPVPDQVLATSFADNDRLVLAGGAGLELPGQKGGVLERPLSLDVGVQYHTLFGRETRKLNPTLPGFSSGGRILGGMFSATARF